MNKLVNELAQKAEDYADDTDLPWLSTYTEKLVELLIRECIDKIENEAAQYVEPVWAVELVNDMKDHFGVKV